MGISNLTICCNVLDVLLCLMSYFGIISCHFILLHVIRCAVVVAFVFLSSESLRYYMCIHDTPHTKQNRYTRIYKGRSRDLSISGAVPGDPSFGEFRRRILYSHPGIYFITAWAYECCRCGDRGPSGDPFLHCIVCS